VKERIFILALVAGIYAVSATTQVAAAPPVKEDPNASPTQNWDKVLPASQRFTVLDSFNGQAVRDNETGLVWEKSPQTNAVVWGTALGDCVSKIVGGRRGWRLPSVHELASLIDPSVASPGPTLTLGHPFLNVASENYWTATTNAQDATYAWLVYFNLGQPSVTLKSGNLRFWCVRGGMNADQY
jgi:hypothetical protein